MKRLRIVGITPAAPKRPAPLPEEVEQLLPYTSDAYAASGTPVRMRISPARRRVPPWTGIGVLGVLTSVTLGLAIAILATRPGTPPALQPAPAQPPELRVLGARNDAIRCSADALTIVVLDDEAGEGVLVGTLSGANAALVFALDPSAAGYTASVTLHSGEVRSPTAIRGQPMTVSPGDTLLLRVDGVPTARRLRVTGEWSFGSRGQEVCQ